MQTALFPLEALNHIVSGNASQMHQECVKEDLILLKYLVFRPFTSREDT